MATLPGRDCRPSRLLTPTLEALVPPQAPCAASNAPRRAWLAAATMRRQAAECGSQKRREGEREHALAAARSRQRPEAVTAPQAPSRGGRLEVQAPLTAPQAPPGAFLPSLWLLLSSCKRLFWKLHDGLVHARTHMPHGRTGRTYALHASRVLVLVLCGGPPRARSPSPGPWPLINQIYIYKAGSREDRAVVVGIGCAAREELSFREEGWGGDRRRI
jgi:hypothetical protein